MEYQINNVNEYYSSIDKNIINNLCKNNNLKNLINLSTQSDVFVFNKRNKTLKSKEKLLNECKQIKNKELKTTSSMLSNLAKLNNSKQITIPNSNSNPTDNVKQICKQLENKMNTIDQMISCINDLDTDSPTLKNYNVKIVNIDEDQYLECYSNC